MLSSFFKRPEVEAQPNANLRPAEQALQDRVNRMLRSGLRV